MDFPQAPLIVETDPHNVVPFSRIIHWVELHRLHSSKCATLFVDKLNSCYILKCEANLYFYGCTKVNSFSSCISAVMCSSVMKSKLIEGENILCVLC